MQIPDSQEAWQQLAEQLQPEARAFIDGGYHWAQSGETFSCISPVDGRELAQVASCASADADLAVAAARRSFEQGVWRDLSPSRRKQVLLRLSELIMAHRVELALLETLDMGKPISLALGDDLPACARCFSWTAEAIDKVYGELAPVSRQQLGMVTREPVGVVAAIVPWNFPLIMAAWKLAPALAMGNSVVLKPSEKSPLSALRLAALAREAGIPDGVFNVLPGYGDQVGKALALHRDVDCLVFTGSTAVARQLLIYAGQSNMKRVWLEAGGKSPNIVFADAPDLDRAAQAAAAAIAYNQGQVCTAGSRLLVEATIADAFVARVAEALAGWQPGHPLDPTTRLGALVDGAHCERVLAYVASAHEQGARCVLDGKQVLTDSGGWYLRPALFDDVKPSMRIAREEVFGPLLSVLRFSRTEEAIALANDSDYGLAAAIWTADLSKAHRTAQALRAGSVWVNQYDAGDMTAPFGGFKQSGNGRDKSLHAFEKYTELKATWIRL